MMGWQFRTYDEQRRRAAQRWLLLGVALFILCPETAVATEPPPLKVLTDVVFIKAHQAWQASDGARFEARGDLMIRGADWEILAEDGHIIGRLRDPDTIHVSGAPARIVYRRAGDEEPLEGQGALLEFQPRKDSVQLEGAARIVKGRQSISSEAIKYLLDRDTFAAGSAGRVRVVTTPR